MIRPSLTGIFWVATIVAAAKDYSNYKLISVENAWDDVEKFNAAVAAAMEADGGTNNDVVVVDVWMEPNSLRPALVMSAPEATEKLLSALASSGLKAEVTANDVKELIQMEKRQADQDCKVPGSTFQVNDTFFTYFFTKN
jgi:hypothetical protein